MARRSSTAQRNRVARAREAESRGYISKGKTLERRPGRPTALTDTTRDTLLGYLLEGNSIEASCALTGVGVATFYRWMNRGEQARIMLDEHGTIPDTEEPFREFREAVYDARAQAESRAVGIVQKAMHGGFVTSEEPVVDVDGNVQYDANTGEVLWKRTRTPPDGRLALAYLQRARPKDWSMAGANINAKVEVSGPGGAPIQVTHEHKQIESLAERLIAVRNEFEQDADLLGDENDDTVDAEVVEDTG